MPRITGEQLAAISREMVRLKADLLGKGPSEAKTYAFDHFIISVLKGGLTKVEQALVAAGDQALVRQVRQRFQEQKSETFTDAVEGILGRKVVAHESQIVFHPDYVFELFVLDESDQDAE